MFELMIEMNSWCCNILQHWWRTRNGTWCFYWRILMSLSKKLLYTSFLKLVHLLGNKLTIPSSIGILWSTWTNFPFFLWSYIKFNFLLYLYVLFFLNLFWGFPIFTPFYVVIFSWGFWSSFSLLAFVWNNQHRDCIFLWLLILW